MFKRPGQPLALVASVLTLLVASAVAYVQLPPRHTSDVAVPAPNATPEQVVTAYLDAWNAHDTERPKDSDHLEVADVPVTFNLNWRSFHNDGSMDDGGATTWSYRLVRHSADSPWRIFDQGTG